MDAVADGLVGNSDGFKAKLASFEQQRDELIRQTTVRKRRDNLPAVPLSGKNIDRFAKSVRLKLRDKDSSFRKRHISSDVFCLLADMQSTAVKVHFRVPKPLSPFLRNGCRFVGSVPD